MAIALGLVGRNPYLSTQQKLVQARVYAQGLTLAVLIATAAFEIGDRNEGQGRWETVKIIDPDDPEHKHLIEKKIHHESYAGEDQWKGNQPLACRAVQVDSIVANLGVAFRYGRGRRTENKGEGRGSARAGGAG